VNKTTQETRTPQEEGNARKDKRVMLSANLRVFQYERLKCNKFGIF
jgi:hypothetical protein